MIYIIGDIHGCISSLKELVNKIGIDKTIYSVGDLCDKGPNSALVIDFMIENNIKVVKGNHEYLYEIHMEKYLKKEDITQSKWWKYWGGDVTVKSYKVFPYKERRKKIQQHLEFIKSLPYFYEINETDKNDRTLFISHGFALPYYKDRNNMNSLTERAYMSNRLKGQHFVLNEQSIKELDKLGVVNVFGHDALKYVQKRDSYIAIDTGCVYGKSKSKGGKLTAITWPSKQIIQVNLKDRANYHFD